MQVESNASRPIDTGGADPGGASAVAAAARLRQQLPFVRRDAHAIEPSPRTGSLLSLVGRRHLRVFARAHERHAALTGAAGSPRWLSALSRLRFGGSSFLSRLRRATGNAHTPSAQATSGSTATGAAASADTQALERLTSSLQQRFAARAADRQGFHALLAQAFGDGYDTARAETIRLQTLAGDFSWMPSIRVADAHALTDTSGTQGEGVVLGAYVAATDTIYVSRELLGDAERAVRLLTEELGHALDARLNVRDAAGDEGEIFSRLVHDGQLDASELAALRAENDHGMVTIDGRSVAVEYGFFSKLKRALKKGVKAVTKGLVKGAIDLAKGSLQMTTGALTLNFDRVREGARSSADAVRDTGKTVFKAIKETDKELRAIAKEALHKLMQSKWFAVILTICRFIPIPIVQLAVRVIDLVRAAYMVYQGVKNRSLSAVFGGVASLAGGAGQLAGALGASASTVSAIGSVATAANNLSMAYNAVAQKDLGAALGLLAGQAGALGSVAGYAQYAQQAYGVARAARDGDVLGAIGNGLSLAGSGVDGANPALAQSGDVVTGLRVAQQIERGNLDAAHGLASSMQVAQQARSEADSLAAQQRAQVAQDDIGGELAPEHVTQDSFGEMSEAPAGDSGASAAAPEAALPDAQPAGPPTFTVEAGQTLESIARSRYGDQWRAGVTQLILENQIALNQWGSPVLRVGQGLTASDLPLDSQRLDALARAGGSIVAINSRGLSAKAKLEERLQVLGEQRSANDQSLDDAQVVEECSTRIECSLPFLSFSLKGSSDAQASASQSEITENLINGSTEVSSMRALSATQGFFIFNPVGRFLFGWGESAAGITSSMYTVPKQTVLTAGDAVANATYGALNLIFSGDHSYSNRSAVFRSIDSSGALGTVGIGVTSTVRSLPGVSQIEAIYRRDMSALGGSIPGTAVALSGARLHTDWSQVRLAKADQIRWGYVADDWGTTSLPSGTKVYGGLPGQSSFYTTASTVEAAGGSRTTLFQSLQVEPHPELGYRPMVGEYEVVTDLRVPSGTAQANIEKSIGGGEQFFIQSYSSSLQLLRTIPLDK